MFEFTALGWVHLVTAVSSLGAGAIQCLRRKGDRLHRRSGYVYALAMSLTNLSALLIYRFTGGFNVFHALAIVNLFSVAMALKPMIQNPRPKNWLRTHYMWILWSYVGLWAATVTEILVRVFHVSGWVAAASGSLLITAVGWYFIGKFAPQPKLTVEEDAQQGARSSS